MATVRDVDELLERMKAHNVSDEHITVLQEAWEEDEYDIGGLLEDMGYGQDESTAFACLEDEELEKRLFAIAWAILNNENVATTTTTTSDNNNTAQMSDVTATQSRSQADEKNNDYNNSDEQAAVRKEQMLRQAQIDDLDTPLFLQHLSKIDRDGLVAQLNGGYCKKDDMRHRRGIVTTLSAGTVQIPDEVIVNGTLLETIWGVTYVLEYNNMMFRPPRLQYTYLELWREYLQQEKPQYGQIALDIQNNDGGLYEYLIEYPLVGRILPVLEKVVEQLMHPRLRAFEIDENAKEEDLDMQHVDTFFRQQCNHWYRAMHKSPAVWQQVQTTCTLFKKNTHSQNFNTFELFNTIMDVYDRILCAPQPWNVRRPADITGTPDNIGEHDFAAALLQSPTPYCEYLNTTLTVMKDKLSFFPRLQVPSLQPHQKLIQDSCREFQKIALAFLMFVKAFMCQSGNELETVNHGRKTKQRVIILPAKFEAKTQDLESRMQAIVVDESDVVFHNGNFPLQIDLVVIPRDDKRTDFGFDADGKEAYFDEFAIAKDVRPMPDVPASAKKGGEAEKQFVCAMYGRMVSVFRDVITKEKNQRSREGVEREAAEEKRRTEPLKRRDDRYVMVVDRRRHNAIYMYPPHIFQHENGSQLQDLKILHREDKEAAKLKSYVENRYSYIADEYNVHRCTHHRKESRSVHQSIG